MKKKIRKIFIIILLVLLGFFVFEHVILVSVATKGLDYVVDLKTRMNRVMINPFKLKLVIRGLKIYNPPGFENKILMNIPTVEMDFKLKTLFQPGAFFNRIVLHIKELNIIRNKEDVVNLSKVKALTPEKEKESKKPFLAEKYIITIDHVRYIDKTKGEDPEIKDIDINLTEEYKNITVADNLANLIAYKIFFNGKIGNIGVDIQRIQANLALLAEKNKQLSEDLKKSAAEKIEKAKEAVKEEIIETKKKVKEKIEEVKQSADKTIDAIVEKTEEVKEGIKEKSSSVSN